MPPLQLRFLGFCGVDESFDDIAADGWPSFVEWGVLFRREYQGQKRRFPSMEWIERFTAAQQQKQHHVHHLAAHLCSADLEQVLVLGDFSFVHRLFHELGFGRFQLNATLANGVDMALLRQQGGAALVKRIAALARSFPQAEFIVQRNAETEFIWREMEDAEEEEHPPPRNVSFLFDSSVGTGVEIQRFDRPVNASAQFGYAGGIHPGNVDRILGGINIALAVADQQSRPIWIDMESGIRDTDDDAFSATKCQQVCAIVLAHIANHTVEIV